MNPRHEQANDFNDFGPPALKIKGRRRHLHSLPIKREATVKRRQAPESQQPEDAQRDQVKGPRRVDSASIEHTEIHGHQYSEHPLYLIQSTKHEAADTQPQWKCYPRCPEL